MESSLRAASAVGGPSSSLDLAHVHAGESQLFSSSRYARDRSTRYYGGYFVGPCYFYYCDGSSCVPGPVRSTAVGSSPPLSTGTFESFELSRW